MEKAKIYATGNETIRGEYNISYYIVEKDMKFLDWLGKLLTEVMEIENGDKAAKFIIRENEDSQEELYAKDLKQMTDFHESYSNKENRLDIFYGKERVFITFRKTREARERLGTFMRKTKEWINIEEVEKIPVPVKNSQNK